MSRQFYGLIVNGSTPTLVGPFPDLAAFETWRAEAIHPHMPGMFFEGLPGAPVSPGAADAVIYGVEQPNVQPVLTPADNDYLARFPPDQRATALRAYEDGFTDAINSQESTDEHA